MRPSTFKFEEHNNELLYLRTKLTEALINSDVSQMQARHVPQIEGAQASAATPGFYYDDRTQQWIGLASRKLNSGVYNIFQATKIQEYLKFCVHLKLLGELRVGLYHIQQLLKVGGDLIAVMYFSKRISLTLKMLESTVKTIEDSQESLMKFADRHYDQLCSQPQKSASEKIWMKNYNALKKLLPISSIQSELFQNFYGSVTKINNIPNTNEFSVF